MINLDESLWRPEQLPDQRGRVAVVTGANSGIGYVTARELARAGALVVLACRDQRRGEDALSRLRAELPAAKLDLGQLDLGSLESIRGFAARWDLGPLDLLVNNAGVAMVPFSRTVDGFESQFGINHLGTFALTGRLLPHLLAAPDPRVVTVSSEGQRFARFDLGNLDGEKRFSTAWAYWQSKMANVYFAVELQRWAARNRVPLRSMVAVPGFAVSNVLSGGANAGRGAVWRALVRLVTRLLAKPTAEGAWTSLFAATTADLPGGSYIAPSGPFEFRGPPVARSGHRAAYDTSTARRLWRRSQELTGVTYEGPRDQPLMCLAIAARVAAIR